MIGGNKIIKFTSFFTDKRGFVCVFIFDGIDYLLIYTKAGFMRGGEIHKGKQWNIFLQGKIKWTQNDGQSEISAPAFIEVPANIPHMMIALSDTLMLEWREFPAEQPTNYYQPYREEIEKHNMVIK